MTLHDEGQFTGAAGDRVYWQAWLPDDKPRAVVALSHGVAEHSGRYTHVAQRFVRSGFATYAVDHRGHGRSEGTRANINRMSDVVADLDRCTRLGGHRHPGVPMFVLGHSMGGLIALDYVTRYQTRTTRTGPLTARS